MINATCVGRLTNDPEVKQDSKGQDYVKFSLACQKTRDTAEFVKCAAFGQKANVVSDFVKKGHQVVCVGRMSLNTYETSDGVKRSDLSLAVTQVCLLTNKTDDSPKPPARSKKAAEPEQEYDPYA